MIPAEDDEAELIVVKMLGLIVLGSVMVTTLIAFFVTLHNLVVWTVSPEGASVEYILRLLQ
jgi:hypothetical protein